MAFKPLGTERMYGILIKAILSRFNEMLSIKSNFSFPSASVLKQEYKKFLLYNQLNLKVNILKPRKKQVLIYIHII